MPRRCGRASELIDPWLLAITVPAKGRGADAALDAGADDYLHRPFTRGELLARARAGVRAAQQRADDMLVRALLVNVPGAIYRSAWHAGHSLELISDEIERISGYPPVDFVASAKRTLMSIVHPRDRKRVSRAVAAAATPTPSAGSWSSTGSCAPTARSAGCSTAASSCTARAGGCGWTARCSTSPSAARPRRRCAARRSTAPARRSCAPRACGSSRPPTPPGAGSSATCTTARSSGSWRSGSTSGSPARRSSTTPSTAAEELDRIGQGLAEASAELRELARGIHPAVLTERGLAAAVEALGTRAPVPVEVVEVPRERLSPSVEATAYFTVAEALTNVAKYAGASHATVRIAQVDSELVVEVADDGVGGADAANGSGLSGLADRVGASDGSLSVSSPPGRGTTIRAVVPLSRASAHPSAASRARASASASSAWARSVATWSWPAAAAAIERSIMRASSESRSSSSRRCARATAACSPATLRRPSPSRRRSGGERRGLPLAHEVGDRLGVARPVGVVEALHERLGVARAPRRSARGRGACAWRRRGTRA